MSLTALFPGVDAPLPTGSGTFLSPQDDFTIFGLALDAAGLTDAVRALDGASVFVPSDAAFVALAQDLGYTGDPQDETAVFGAIAAALGTLAPDNDPIPLLTDILLYHVAPTAADASALEGSGPVTTLLQGASFQITGGTVVDGDGDATNADLVVRDVAAGDVTLQVIDRVLLPIDTPIANADPTLLDLLKESGGAPDDTATDFDLLLLALQATGLDAAVDDPAADLTVFIPDDQAFIDFARDLGYEGTDEAGALAAILSASAAADPENPLALVEDVLAFHVVPGGLRVDQVSASSSLPTLLGPALGVDGLSLVDADPDAANAAIVTPDLLAANGIAQGIDAVLRPLDFPPLDEDPGNGGGTPPQPGTLLDILSQSGGTPDDEDGDFDLLLTALRATGLDAAVDDPEADLTVFIPNDRAFISLAQDLGFEGEDEAGALATILEASAAANPDDPLALVRDVLEIHVSPGAQTLAQITASDSVATLSGVDLGRSEGALVDADPDNQDANIIAPDIAASNGIAHGIDEVLLPLDLPQVPETPDTPEQAEAPEQTEPQETPQEDDGFELSDLGLAVGFALLLFLFI